MAKTTRYAPKDLGRGRSKHKTPSHLLDYIFLLAQAQEPPSSSPLQKVSSGKPYPIVNYITSNRFSNAHRNYIAVITKVMAHRYFHVAVKDARWRKAMAKEIEAPELNETRTIEDLPVGKKPINYKCMYKVKYNIDGSIVRHEVRLTQGNQQVAAFKYYKKFALAAKMVSVYCFLSTAAVRR